ncbi:MAG: GIY-YIG nuclease family protein [Nitrososphaerota archaeon]
MFSIPFYLLVKGVYLLFLEVLEEVNIKVGSIGLISFPAGLYVYVGSAQNNVEARIRRHFEKRKMMRWHIDYLASSCKVKVLYAVAYPLPKKYECRLARFIEDIGSESISRFGASDCRCRSHLFNMRDLKPINLIKRISKSLELGKKTRHKMIASLNSS